MELLLGFLDMKEENESSFVAQVFEEPFYLLRVLWQLKLGAGISHTNIQPSVPVFTDMTRAGDRIGDASLGGYQIDTTGFKLRGMELFYTAGSLQGMTIWPVSKNTGFWGKLF